MNKKYYITTPIFYASAKPQLGNAYTAVLADAISRYKKLNGYDVIFQTGMDEHGHKVQLKAEENNQNPQDFVDGISLEVKRVLESVNVDYDTFARTTNPKHKEVVQKIFQKLYDKKDIYKGKYEGWYCTPCESFFTEQQLIEGKCPDCGREVEWSEEEAYFLNLKKYESWLKDYIINHEDFIIPKARRNEMLKFIEQGLDDLCVSRTSFDWGIKVPFNEKHVIYVWLDALTNYITFQGYLTDNEKFNNCWPADLHLVGKDILRFHTIYWPIMLKALELPITKQILGHPFLVDANGGKMSKSKGNILYADELTKEFGVDAIRYYLLSEIGIINDGNVSKELIVEKYNSDLANTLGNLVNRTINMSKKYFDKVVYKPTEFENIDKEIIEMSKTLGNKIDKKIDELKISEALNEIFKLLRRANKYIDETEPWTLFKENKEERLKTVLYNLLEMIRISAVYLYPFMPDTSDEIFKQLNTQNRSIESTKDFKGMDPGIVLNEPKIIFQRIDKE